MVFAQLRRALAVMALGTAACTPSRSTLWSPVDREIQRRVGVAGTWQESADGDARVPAAIAKLLEQPIDRDAAVRIALATNRRLQAHYARLGIAAADVANATVLRPLSVHLEAKAHDGSFGELEVDVFQDILGLVQLGQRRSAANAELAAVRARAVAATVTLVARVEIAYIDVIAAQQDLELRQTAFLAAEASAELAGRQYAAGNISDLVVWRERERLEMARVELARARVTVDTSRAGFDEVLGLANATAWTVTARLPELPAAAPALDRLEDDAIAASLELQALRAEADAAGSRLGIARVRTVLPELGVGVAAHREDGEWAAGPALSVGIPLFDQQQGPRARAHAEIAAARNTGLAVVTEVRTRSRAVRQRLLGTYIEAKQLRDVVLPMRKRIVDETLLQYNAMNATPFELLVARRELVDAGRDYIDALRRFWRVSAEARVLARGGSLVATEDAVETRNNAAPAQHGGGH